MDFLVGVSLSFIRLYATSSYSHCLLSAYNCSDLLLINIILKELAVKIDRSAYYVSSWRSYRASVSDNADVILNGAQQNIKLL